MSITTANNFWCDFNAGISYIGDIRYIRIS